MFYENFNAKNLRTKSENPEIFVVFILFFESVQLKTAKAHAVTSYKNQHSSEFSTVQLNSQQISSQKNFSEHENKQNMTLLGRFIDR